jgi:TIR domain
MSDKTAFDGANSMEFIRLDGTAGTKPGYLNGFIQTYAEVDGYVVPIDGEQVDVLDLNAVPCATPAALALRSSGAKPSGQATGPAAVPQLITDPPKTLVEIFFSYSHKDATLLDKLVAHLSQLKHQGLIAGWHDRKIAAGAEWEGQIDGHLNSARVILLLISADFLASRYCYDVEMKRALERHSAGEARVIPIILRPCDWHASPFGKLQALPNNGAKPVTEWRNQDKAFTDVARGIRAAVTELTV